MSAGQVDRLKPTPTENRAPIERLRSMLDLVAAEADEGEAQGRLTDTVIARLKSEGLFSVLTPKCYGGSEVSPLEAIELFEALARVDGSTGWVVATVNSITAVTAAFLPDSAADAIFSNKAALVAGQGAPRGRAVVEGNGYRLTGKWSYGSGILHADYVHTGARVYENGQAGAAITCILPVEQMRTLGNWDVLGLKGTGSVDYIVEDVFVPREFTHSPDTLVPLRGSDMFRMGIVGISPIAHGAFALGVGRHILDELTNAATSSGGKPSALTDGSGEGFYEGFGIADGRLRAGRAFLYEVYDEVEQTVRKGDPISMHQFSLMRLALIDATMAAVEAGTFAFHAAGGVALRAGMLQRAYRDIMAGNQHRIVSNFMLRECSRELLGLAKDKAWTSYGLADAASVKLG